MSSASPYRGARVLVVDDAPATLEILRRNLVDDGYDVLTAAGVLEATHLLEQQPMDLVITDIKMPGASGIELTRYVRENCRSTEVMVITGYPSLEGAVQAVKLGAEDYLAKPFTDEELAAAVRRSLERLSRRRNGRAPAEREIWARYGLVTCAERMLDVLAAASRAAVSREPVLIEGEPGTGKALVARAIHGQSGLTGPFLTMSCAGLPAEQIEEELFGCDGRRARAWPGLLSLTARGTLYLDEMEGAAPRLQARLGEQLPRPGRRRRRQELPRLIIGVVDLSRHLRQGYVSADLCQALGAQQIALPPLRERGDDVLLLAEHFAALNTTTWSRRPIAFSEAAQQALRSYQWPGNVRELRGVIRDLQGGAASDRVDAPDLPPQMRFRFAERSDVGVGRTLEEVEAEHIRNTMVAVAGNKAQAAQVLRIDRKTLREKLRRYNIDRSPQ
jgi:two-component system, NtrC family, response regulator HydG